MIEKRLQRFQLRIEIQPVKRGLSVQFEDFVCAAVTVPALKSVARKRLVEALTN
jgi:hypothetical protein